MLLVDDRLAQLQQSDVVLIGDRVIFFVYYLPTNAIFFVAELLRLSLQVVVSQTQPKIGGRYPAGMIGAIKKAVV